MGVNSQGYIVEIPGSVTAVMSVPDAGENNLTSILRPTLATGSGITIYVKITGDATGIVCLVRSTPCGTFTSALNLAASLNGAGLNVVIDFLDTGPYVGGTLTGRPTGTMRAYDTRGPGQNPYVELLGSGSGTTVLTQPALQNSALRLTTFANVLLNNITLSVTTARGIGLFSQNHSYVVVKHALTVTSAIAGITGLIPIHAENYSTVEFDGDLTYGGSWSGAGFDADMLGYFEFDPGHFTVTCKAGYSNAKLFRLKASVLNSQNVVFSGCPTTTPALLMLTNSSWSRNRDASDLPGTTYQINGIDDVSPPYIPSLSSCTNGDLDTASTNYSGSFTISGPASTCSLKFGKASAGISYFTHDPGCTISSNIPVTVVGVNTTDFTVAGSFIKGSTVWYTCLPHEGYR
jgi:hypothetical protein